MKPSISLSASLTGAVVGYHRSNALIISLTEEPHNFNADPDPAFNFDADPDPTFQFNTGPDMNQDPDPVFIKVMQICDHYLQTPHDSILSLHASIVSVHGSSKCYVFKPLLLLNFYYHADPDMDPAFHSNADLDPASQNNADLCRSGFVTQWRRPVLA